MFAHFKPFSKDRPLYETVCTEESVIRDFRAYNFTQSAKAVMDNWEALNESSDAQEAERPKKEHATVIPKRTADCKLVSVSKSR